MKIAISGASGKTGFRIAEEALLSGYSTKLLIRKNSVIPKSIESCPKETISLCNKAEINNALKGVDALIIATGARPSIDLTGPAKVDALGVKNQVECCKDAGIKRIILVSSLCAGKLIHPLNLFGLILVWKRIGEEFIEKSGLDWTIIRPGGLNENESQLDKQKILYTESKQQEEGSIPRRLVARACIESIREKNSIGKIIEITSGSDYPKTNMKNAIKSFNI
tara:strand:+ start:3096 stop:3764 length:669 start_codon:yes stop_codon:yes gene_type:complete